MDIPEAEKRGADLSIVELDNIVDFDDAEDPTNPLNWSKRYKWFMVVLVSLMTTVITLAVLICTPAVPQILDDLHSTSSYNTVLIVSIWELGEVFGPFVIAPLSELYGRLRVWHTANMFFIVFSIASGFSCNIPMLIALRFLNGVASPYVLGSAIIGDLFRPEQRGTAISIASMMPLIGPTIGPIIGSFTSKSLGWRWTFWLVAMVTAFVECLLLIFMRETYAVTILEKKARKLRKLTGNEALRSKYDKEISPSSLLLRTFLRPIKFIAASPIVAMLSLYSAVVYGYLYIILTTMTELLESTYDFSEDAVGLSFIGVGLGLGVGSALCKFQLDSHHRKQKAKGRGNPEDRLRLMVIGALFLPPGLFIYGWTAKKGVPWIVPIIGTALIGFGQMVTLIPIQTYLVDAFTIRAASAVAAGGVFRSIAGCVFPLAGPPLYTALGQGWGNSLLGFIALTFIPVPILLSRYGQYLRERFPVEL